LTGADTRVPKPWLKSTTVARTEEEVAVRGSQRCVSRWKGLECWLGHCYDQVDSRVGIVYGT
jgi:hypothetical protein